MLIFQLVSLSKPVGPLTLIRCIKTPLNIIFFNELCSIFVSLYSTVYTIYMGFYYKEPAKVVQKVFQKKVLFLQFNFVTFETFVKI